VVSENNCDIDSILKLSIDKQKLSAILRIEPNKSSTPITVESLCAFLEGSNINAQCIDRKEIAKLIEMSDQNPDHAQEMVVVKGTPPVEGKNAGFDFCDHLKSKIDEITKREEAYLKAEQENSLSTANPEDSEEDENAIDFYNMSPFLIVSKGDLIGHIHGASIGEDGVNVNGQAIPTKPGKELTDLTDDSFKIDSQGDVYALIDGHLTHTATKLKINPTLEIAHYVDFSTGNIKFSCDVIVNEGVRDRFSIKAGKNIEVRKLVEASILESKQDIILHSGMSGRETGTITAGGNLKAGYLDGIHGSIAGNCEVNKEITNCHINIGGSLQSPHAALRGGEACISKGGIIGSIGSAQGIKTNVLIGWIPEIEQKAQLAQSLRKKVEDTIAKQKQDLETLKKSIGKPNREQETEIEFMKFEITILEGKMNDIDSVLDRLGKIIRKNTSNKIEIKSMVFAKTVIWFRGYRITFENDVKGELALDLDKKRKPVVIRNGNTEPMHTVASVIADDRILPLYLPPQDDTLSDDSDDDGLSQAA